MCFFQFLINSEIRNQYLFYKQNVHSWIIHLPSRARLARSKDIVTTLVENIPIESLAVPLGNMKGNVCSDWLPEWAR